MPVLECESADRWQSPTRASRLQGARYDSHVEDNKFRKWQDKSTFKNTHTCSTMTLNLESSSWYSAANNTNEFGQ